MSFITIYAVLLSCLLQPCTALSLGLPGTGSAAKPPAQNQAPDADDHEIAYINIIRHGEDLPEGNQLKGPSKGLADTGKRRAQYLMQCMASGNKSLGLPFGKPTGLVTVDISTLRPRMTIEPLASELGLDITAPCLEGTPAHNCSAPALKRQLKDGSTIIVSLTRQIMYDYVKGLDVIGHDEWMGDMLKKGQQPHACASIVPPARARQENKKAMAKKSVQKKTSNHHLLDVGQLMEEGDDMAWQEGSDMDLQEAPKGFSKAPKLRPVVEYIIRGECFDELWQVKLMRPRGQPESEWKAVSVNTLSQGFEPKKSKRGEARCAGALAPLGALPGRAAGDAK